MACIGKVKHTFCWGNKEHTKVACSKCDFVVNFSNKLSAKDLERGKEIARRYSEKKDPLPQGAK